MKLNFHLPPFFATLTDCACCVRWGRCRRGGRCGGVQLQRRQMGGFSCSGCGDAGERDTHVREEVAALAVMRSGAASHCGNSNSPARGEVTAHIQVHPSTFAARREREKQQHTPSLKMLNHKWRLPLCRSHTRLICSALPLLDFDIALAFALRPS